MKVYLRSLRSLCNARPVDVQAAAGHHPAGGAISSSPFGGASGRSWVTDTAAIRSTIARHTNTVVSPQPLRIHSIAGTMPAVASRPTPAAQPKPEARALVGK